MALPTLPVCQDLRRIRVVLTIESLAPLGPSAPWHVTSWLEPVPSLGIVTGLSEPCRTDLSDLKLTHALSHNELLPHCHALCCLMASCSETHHSPREGVKSRGTAALGQCESSQLPRLLFGSCLPVQHNGEE